MTNEYRFMEPITKAGAADKVALANAMKEARYGSLDAHARTPFAKLR